MRLSWRACGGGVNSVSIVLGNSSLAPVAFASIFSSLLSSSLLSNAVPCPPDIPILTLPNGDANRDGVVDEADYAFVEARLGEQGGPADLNGDGEDLAIVLAHKGLNSDAAWSGGAEPQGWYRLEFAIQLGDYVPRGYYDSDNTPISVRVVVQDAVLGRTYASLVSLGSLPAVVSLPVPTGNPYVVQVQAPAGGSWLTITRKEVSAVAPAPMTYGTPFAWQGSLPVSNGVFNPANGNVMLGLGLFGWGGQAGVAFGLVYNAQDSRSGALGVGWRHSYQSEIVWVDGNTVQLSEPDGRVLEFYRQPDGSFVSMRGVYDELRFANDAFVLVRASGVRWHYAPAGDGVWRLVSVRDLNGQGVDLEYNPAGQFVSVQDTTGRTAVLAYYGAGDVVPDNPSVGVPESWYGRLKSVSDTMGRVWHFTYYPYPTGSGGNGDLERGNEGGSPHTEVFLRSVIWPVRVYNGAVEVSGAAYLFMYSDGRLNKWRDRAGYWTAYTYDLSGRLTNYEYLGRQGENWMVMACAVPIEYPQAIGSPTRRVKIGASLVEGAYLTYEYDALGRLVRTIDPLGRVSLMEWNLSNQLQWVRSPSGATYHFCWDERGNLTRVEDPLGNWTELEWTVLNRLKAVRDVLTPAGQSRYEYDYNPYGNLERVRELAGSAGSAGSYALTHYQWDVARGLLQEAWDANSHRTQQYEYDGWGYVRSVKDALGNGGAVQRNALGWIEEATDARGYRSVFSYDSWGWLRAKAVYASDGTLVSTTVYTYADTAGRLAQVQESSGRTTSYTYRAATGELYQVVSPEGVVEYSWTRGLLSELRVQPAGEVGRQWKYVYNAANELEKVQALGSNHSYVDEVVYVRDGFGRLLEAQVQYPQNRTRVRYV